MKDDIGQNELPYAGDWFLHIRQWLTSARDFGDEEVDAVSLATVDEAGYPNVRIVYARKVEARGVGFFTNYQSQKGQELQSQKAAMNFYFPKWQRQIRLRGDVLRMNAEDSDEYFRARPLESRKGAWASQQSQRLESFAQFHAEYAAISDEQAQSRPPHWGGYWLMPWSVEFWKMGAHRLHERIIWEKINEDWAISRRYP